MSYKNAKKKLDQIVNSFNLDEMVESVKDNLSHFEELDILKGHDLSINYNFDGDDSAIVYLSIDVNDGYEGEFTGIENKFELDLKPDENDNKYQQKIVKFIKEIEDSESIELIISVLVNFKSIEDNNFKKGLDYLKSISKIDGILLEIGSPSSKQIELFFIKSEKTSKFIGDPFEKLPNHLVTKFKEFAKKYDLKVGGKKDLVNLFRSSNI